MPLLPAQDFKRAHDGDDGPNTGGMGAYAPLPWAPPGLADEVLGTVIQPALDELRRRGTPYRGLLYAGLGLTAAGPRVIEFNARFGDPETQVVLDRLATPLAGLLAAAASGDRWRGVAPPSWARGRGGHRGHRGRGLPGPAGLRRRDHWPGGGRRVPAPTCCTRAPGPTARVTCVSAGGRVLNVVGTGPDLAAARAVAYRAAGQIEMRGGWYRTDIAAAGGRTAGAGQPVTGEPPASSTARCPRARIPGRTSRCGSARWSCSSTWSSRSR